MRALLSNPVVQVAIVLAFVSLAVGLGVRSQRKRTATFEAEALRLGLSYSRRDPELLAQPFLALPFFQRERKRDFSDVVRGDGLWVFELVSASRTGKNPARQHPAVAAVRVAAMPGGAGARPSQDDLSDPGWSLQGEGEWVIAFRPGRRLEASDLAEFVTRARQQAQRFAQQ